MSKKELTKQERMEILLGAKDSPVKKAKVKSYDICPSRIPELNGLLPGGFVKGKVNLLFGSASAGKSTTAIETIADEQKRDPDHVCLLIPSERGEDLSYYSNLGLDMDGVLILDREVYILEEVFDYIIV